tara:strand:+ start:187 stop:678 length:492 start_codon:yes stop_codon:yes gene_type:complete
MGNTPSDTNYQVFSRNKQNGWNKKPIFQLNETLQDPPNKILGKFKHIVWRFALRDDEKLNNLIAIYLYQGSERKIKAEIIKDISSGYIKLEMTFFNDQWASDWDKTDEKILSNEILWKEDTFNNNFAPLEHEKLWMRKWISYKELEKNTEQSYLQNIAQYIWK